MQIAQKAVLMKLQQSCSQHAKLIRFLFSLGQEPLKAWRCYDNHTNESSSNSGCSRVSSKEQLQPELNVARAPRRQDAPEGRRPEKVIRQIKVRMIEQIERFRPQLQIESFS
jgi:hypothetical protein